MQDIIQQIREANKTGLYYVALFSALALPDICAALESDDGQASKAKFIAWFNANVAPKYNGSLDGETCYYFRCSMLHQGSTQNPRAHYSRIIFIEPVNAEAILHNNILKDALNIDVGTFCDDICSAAEDWWQRSAVYPKVRVNLTRFVMRYPNGLPPYISGVPVIG